MTSPRRAAAQLLPLALALAACRGGRQEDPVVDWLGGDTAGRFAAGYEAFRNHTGPPVSVGATGPFPFAEALVQRFDGERALADAAWIDRWHREPANDGYEAVLDHLERELRAAGYGALGFELEQIVTPRETPAWTPLAGRLELLLDGRRETLLAFTAGTEDDRARTMLPTNAPSAAVEGRAALALRDLRPGDVLVTEEPLDGSLLRRAREAGAAAVLSSHLAEFNTDPTGRDRHLDAIHYGSVRPGTELPVAHVSPRVHARIREAAAGGEARLALLSEVRLDERPLRTLVARLEGTERPHEAVVLAAHVQEPGAVDNASGVAGLLEAARCLRELVSRGALTLPRRSLVLLWGDEYTMSRVFLDHTDLEVVAAFSSDMTGPSREKTGAVALFEREPDPGALVTLPPDRHSAWGAGEVDGPLNPSGLSIVARCAMIDVALLDGGWTTADHPWEGGSDHDVFLARGIPAGLFWHFTDFAYHTSLDRLEHVDADELRRTTSALVAAGLALADARPADLERYLRSLAIDRRVRLAAARDAGNEELVAAWSAWFEGARHWLRRLCLGIDADEESAGGGAAAQPPGADR